MNGSQLVADALTRRYGRHEALRGVSVTVGAGELLGLLGPNGAGKTTLLSILAGLSAADAGTVTVDGEPLTPTSADLRRRIGLATQDVAVYPDLTARENLHFFGRLYGLHGADLNHRVDEVLSAVALSDVAHRRAGVFSGGMKRRLNLGVAIVHRPRILLLDEPTTGVDPQSRGHIFEQIRALNADGLTVIYTSHYMEEVEALCPRVVILDHGRVIAADAVPALLRTLPTTLTLELAAPPPPPAEWLAALPRLAGVTAGEVTGGQLILRATDPADALPRVLASATEHGATITRIHLAPPTLERVFLNLTGSGLRD